MAVLANDPALVGLALQVARTPAAQLDVGAVVAGVCGALPMAVGVAGAVVVLRRAPDPLTGPVFASDAAAMRLGELQHSRSAGPVQEAIRTGRVVTTADLTRADTVEVSAVAAETGLASAVTVPLLLDGRPAGALQLLGTGYRPVPAELAEVVRPLVEVLSARLADANAFRTLTAAVARSTAALEGGLPIAHAAGIVAERYRTDVEEAARFLAGAASRAGLSVEAHAAAVVEGVGHRDRFPGAGRGDEHLRVRRDDIGPGLGDDGAGEPLGRRHRRDDAAGPLSWLAGDLPLPRHSRARLPGAPAAPRHGRGRHGGGTSGDDDPGDPPTSPRHRRADIS